MYVLFKHTTLLIKHPLEVFVSFYVLFWQGKPNLVPKTIITASLFITFTKGNIFQLQCILPEFNSLSGFFVYAGIPGTPVQNDIMHM